MENQAEYRLPRAPDEATIENALRLVLRPLRAGSWPETAPEAIQQYLTLRYARQERRVYGLLLFDSDRCLIETLELAFDAAPSMRVLTQGVLLFESHSVVVFSAFPSAKSPNLVVEQRISADIGAALSNIEVSIISQFMIHGTDIRQLQQAA